MSPPPASRTPADAFSLRVHVGDLLGRRGLTRPIERRIRLDHLRTSVADVSGEPLVLALRLEALADGVLVSGRIRGEWSGECSRCLESVSGSVDLEARELYELEPVEGETYALDGEELDLEPMVRDVVLVNLPLVPLCEEACAGLCPVCGVNRNEGSCGHDDLPADPRWSELDQLKIQLTSELPQSPEENA